MTVTRSEDVEFPDRRGTTLRGRIFHPPSTASGPRAGVIMAHGFSATKEMALFDYAEIIADGGFSVLVYDHAHLGTSDGEPRQLIDPWIQTDGYGAALDWLANQPGIDPQRLGAWGSSFSAGHVLVLGALDDRVRAVVANVPFVGKVHDVEDANTRFEEMASRLAAASETTDEVVGPFYPVHGPNIPPDGIVLMEQDEAAEWFLSEGNRPPAHWRNEVFVRQGTLAPAGPDRKPGQRAASISGGWNPALAISRIRAATLFVATLDDANCPTVDTLVAFNRAPTPKEMVVLPGHHFVPYRGEPLIHAATAARDFYRRWL
jgi:cephalosporin-C deacetylase-like acetyl esterase